MSVLTSPQFTLLVILLASSHCQTEEGVTSHTPSPTTVHPPETGKYATQHRTSHKGTNQPDKTNKPPTYPPSLSRTNSRTQKSGNLIPIIPVMAIFGLYSMVLFWFKKFQGIQTK